jgi:predicted transposase YdaD
VIELNPELPATLRRIDLLLRGVCRVTAAGPSCERLLALDWQVQPDPELPATLFLRAALAYFKYRVRVTTLLLAATQAAAAASTRLVWAEHERGEIEHDVLVFRLFEQDAERALAQTQPELWVLAAAMVPADGDRAALLARVQDRLMQFPGLSRESRERLLDFATTFATLEMSKAAATAFVQAAKRRSQTMLDLRQSGYAQMLLSEGEAKGEARGEAKGEARGQAKAILAILEARQTTLNDTLRQKILQCDDLGLLQQWLMLAIDGRDAELRQQVRGRKAKTA